MTLKTNLQELMKVAINFANLKKIDYSDFDEFEQIIATREDYPRAVVQIGNLSGQNTEVTLTIHYLDILSDDKSNKLQIHSDFNAFCAYMYNNFDMIYEWSGEFYNQVLGQNLAGGAMSISLKQNNLEC